MRSIRNINDQWQFIKEDINVAEVVSEPANNWSEISLPHTWNAVDGANGFDYFKGACWYRKEISLTQDDIGRRIFIEFKGAGSVADVYMNGEHMGQHRGAFSTFRFDVTDHISSGSNTLAVRVDNTVVEDVYPQVADFTFFGGLYRDVNLIVTDQIHIDLMDHGASGVYIAQDSVSEEKAILPVKVLVKNEEEEETHVRVWVDFIDAEGIVQAYAAKEVDLGAGECKEVKLTLQMDSPVLWHGRNNPYMYTAEVSVQCYNDTVDKVSTPIGLRYFEVDPEKGFYLNGEQLRLNGVSRHQDRKDKGWAISEQDHQEDMALIKEVGATSIRLAHYQHDQFFYDLCDQEGMVVWAEIPFISVMSKTELEGINPKQQMIELIRQNYNHPSIFFWGVQNEIQIGGDRPEIRRLVKELNALTKKEDSTRLTTMANVMFVPDDDEYNHMTDIIGYNKYYGWYQGKAEDFEPWLDGFHKTNPDVSLCISEYGAEGIIRYHSETPEVKDYTEEYHALYHEKVWKIFREREYLWATYVWNMFDFGANIRDEGGVKGRNNKGLVTYDRKVKKDAFYMYKSQWSKEPFVHIGSRRFIERAQDMIDVKVYTNCSHVVMTINGSQTIAKDNVDGIMTFEDIRLADGANVIQVKAVSEDGTVCRDLVQFELVSEANASYEAPESEGGIVSNWFQMPEDIEEVVIEPLEISDDVMSTKVPIKVLMSHPESRKIVNKYFGDVESQPMYGMMEGMSIDILADMDSKTFTDKLKYQLNKELIVIPK